MVEVFKTNVLFKNDARELLEQIHSMRGDYRANFDLDDCDHILRIASDLSVDHASIIQILRCRGFEAEILEDIPISDFSTWFHGEIGEGINLHPGLSK